MSLEDALAGAEGEIRRCGTERFEAVDMDKTRGKVSFILSEKEQGPFRSMVIEKRYHLRQDTLTVAYTLSNRGEEETQFRFAPVLELSFPGDGEDYLRIFANGTPFPAGEAHPLDLSNVEILKFQDFKNETIISLGADKVFDARIISIHCPVPEKSFPPGHSTYQSTCIMPLLNASLSGGESWGVVFSLKFTN
jgi:hypothetical protein